MEHWIVDSARDGKTFLIYDDNAGDDARFIRVHGGSYEDAIEIARRMNEGQSK